VASNPSEQQRPETATTGISAALATGETRRLVVPDGSDPGPLLEAFVTDEAPFDGEWLETDDGQFLRKSAVVRVFLQTDEERPAPGTTAPGFIKTARPYNVS
jgi:hypothetical protein